MGQQPDTQDESTFEQLATKVGTITAASANVIAIIANFDKVKDFAVDLYKQVTAYMDSYLENNGLSGATKKEIVLSLIRDEWEKLTNGDTSIVGVFQEWYEKISLFIDKVYEAFWDTVNRAIELKNQVLGLA